jgi:alpha-ketoglutarate-dependent 2,4-dichlorophenoxyacetate dioxygenase
VQTIRTLLIAQMPHAVDFNLIQVKELHPTFGAEVHGVDFSRPVPEDVFQELWKAVNKVSRVI